MRRVVLAVLTSAVLAGCGVREVALPATLGPSTPPAPPVVTCWPEGVVFSVAGTDAAMGVRVLTVEMTNCGSAPYPVNGYPSVRLLDEGRRPLPVTLARGSASIAAVPGFDAPPTPMTLRPGEKARAGLLWRNLVTDTTVDAVTAVHLEAAATPDGPWRSVPAADAGGVHIDLGTTGQLGVQAWQEA
ncbi:DUF4232 domain-containing protein [Actinophytocola xanthii]|uniref:DUF4232 domain-containing protein n=1 Tax=Actinophytocola xanthii TaxID=1912961 RepID=A0A1Q8CU40_9PSEU|nr:DUF4232 domain-containing protein [Actinophytocola xanthii]OLF17878.1 hypothetical protein BU204_08680 [Actinophytocola xanthii]